MRNRRHTPWSAVVIASVLLAFGPSFLPAQPLTGDKAPTPAIRADDLLAVADPAFAASAGKDRFERFRKLALGDGPGEVVAFQEHSRFTVAVTESPRERRLATEGKTPPTWIRRLVLLKPSTWLVYDQVHASAAEPVSLMLHSQAAAEVDGRRVRIAGPSGELLGETVAPAGLTIEKDLAGAAAPAGHVVRVAKRDGAGAFWALHLFHVRAAGDARSPAKAEGPDGNGRWKVTTDGHVFRLWLPPWGCAAGDISVEKAGGEVVLPRQLLPKGVLPFTPEGIQLLDRWDSAYHGDRRPGWDTGRPSSELKRLVEDGTLRPCRAVDLGCGSGTNVVYLAGKGFSATGIDLAPTALARADEKARQSKVRAQWLLADVVRPPALAPFQLIFDRGCYHGLRSQQAKDYVEALKRLSKPGTRVLILAGNANEKTHYGPPRVKEEDIRRDFSADFHFEWLRETRFDTLDPAGQGALAWSILLRRK